MNRKIPPKIRSGISLCLARFAGVLLLTGMLCGLELVAAVDFRTTIQDIQLGGVAERTGMITMCVNGDEFPDATPSNPIYLKLRMSKNALLSETLVDIIPSETGHQPIGVVASVNSSSGSVINLQDLSLTIVRWRKGEKEIWLKITTSSSFWVTRNGVPGPPTVSEPVIIVLGQTVAESLQAHRSDFESGRANLPAPTRNDGTQVDMPLLVDLRQSNLQAAPAPAALSLLDFDPLVLGSDTQGVEFDETPPGIGTLLFVILTGDTVIGRGVGFRIDRWLHHIPREGGGFTSLLHFTNRNAGAANMMLRAYDSGGDILEEQTVVVAGDRFRTLSKQDIFAEIPVSHLQILGPEDCLVGISYRALGVESLTASSPESRKSLNFWDFIPETEAFGFDGFALVNLGLTEASLTLSFLDENGAMIGERTLFLGENFIPFSKKLLLLNDVIPEGTNPALVRFQSQQALGVVALRGTLPGNGPRSLFPVPVFTTVLDD